MSVREDTEKLAAEAPRSGETPQDSPGPTENVDRIREILFGPQLREYEQRLTRLEERISQETTEVKADVRRRLDALEVFVRQEGDGLAERLQTERRERTESHDLLARAQAESLKSLERTLGQFNDRLSKDLPELRQMTLERINNLLDDVSLQIKTHDVVQQRHLEEMRATSIDRFALASLLTEVASSVRNGSRVSKSGDATSFIGPDSNHC